MTIARKAKGSIPMTEGFKIERNRAFLHITIDRPDEGNRVTDPMLDGLATIVDEASSDSELKGIVLRGAGADFCHGRVQGTPPPEGKPNNAFEIHERVMSRILGVYAAFRRCPVPIIAVVQGKALGFGCALVGGADISIACRGATFALTEMPHGTAPTLALSALSHVAPKTLMDMVLTVDEHDAEHALASGIVSRLVDNSDLENTIGRVLETLSGFDRTNISTCKRFIQRGLTLDPDTMSDLAGYTLATVRSRA
jgi:enoyl-CoA hydratase/carnithine racemase